MTTVLWIIAGIFTLVFLAMLLMLFLRKIQFDAMHQNFLELEDEIGGSVQRSGFAARPRYNGEFKGQKVSISFTTEKSDDGERRYYITVTMEARARLNFSILSAAWMGSKPPDEKRTLIPLKDGQYLLEPRNSTQLHKIKLPKVEACLDALAPFAYILMAKTGMILERTSMNISQDTKAPPLLSLLDAMVKFKGAVE